MRKRSPEAIERRKLKYQAKTSNIRSGLTEAEGILENSRASNISNLQGSRARGGKANWIYGRTYENNDEFDSAGVDFTTNTISYLHSMNGNHITRKTVLDLQKPYSWFLSVTRKRKPKRLKKVVKEINEQIRIVQNP